MGPYLPTVKLEVERLLLWRDMTLSMEAKEQHKATLVEQLTSAHKLLRRLIRVIMSVSLSVASLSSTGN